MCLPSLFGGSTDLTFGINWAGDNGGSLSWGAGDGDDSSTCLYGLWNNVRCSPGLACVFVLTLLREVHSDLICAHTARPRGVPRIRQCAAVCRAATPLVCDDALQGQPYSCQGSQSSSGCKYHVPKGCGAKAQYPTYILGKVRICGKILLTSSAVCPNTQHVPVLASLSCPHKPWLPRVLPLVVIALYGQ